MQLHAVLNLALLASLLLELWIGSGLDKPGGYYLRHLSILYPTSKQVTLDKYVLELEAYWTKYCVCSYLTLDSGISVSVKTAESMLGKH